MATIAEQAKHQRLVEQYARYEEELQRICDAAASLLGKLENLKAELQADTLATAADVEAVQALIDRLKADLGAGILSTQRQQ